VMQAGNRKAEKTGFSWVLPKVQRRVNQEREQK
jgi:hypothetical protein